MYIYTQIAGLCDRACTACRGPPRSAYIYPRSSPYCPGHSARFPRSPPARYSTTTIYYSLCIFSFSYCPLCIIIFIQIFLIIKNFFSFIQVHFYAYFFSSWWIFTFFFCSCAYIIFLCLVRKRYEIINFIPASDFN